MAYSMYPWIDIGTTVYTSLVQTMPSIKFVLFCLPPTVRRISSLWTFIQWDCGLYSIAYATGLCCGEDVSSRIYNTVRMRQHLLECFKNGKMAPFPRSYREKGPIVAKETVKVRCYCMPHARFWRNDPMQLM